MPVVSLPPYLGPQYFDQDGQPLAGGKIYTYAGHTSTPLGTYADSGGVALLPNPVPLDASGRAEIWLLINTAYKFITQTSTGVTLWTVDDVVAAIPVGPPPGSVPPGFVFSTNTLTLSASGAAGQGVLTWPGGLPAQAVLLGIGLEVTQTLGGPATLALGLPGSIGLFGAGLSPGVGVKAVTPGGVAPSTVSRDIQLVAEGAAYTGVGEAAVTRYILAFS